MAVRFTKNEIELIQHRLDISEAIAECLMDNPDGQFLKADEIDAAATRLSRAIRGSVEDLIATASPLDLAVLRNAIEFSTYVIRADDEAAFEGKPHIRRAAVQALRGIGEKLNTAGFDVDINEAMP